MSLPCSNYTGFGLTWDSCLAKKYVASAAHPKSAEGLQPPEQPEAPLAELSPGRAGCFGELCCNCQRFTDPLHCETPHKLEARLTHYC